MCHAQLKYKRRVYKTAQSLHALTARKYAELNSKVSALHIVEIKIAESSR